MKYEKPLIYAVGNARALVLGRKGPTPVLDSVSPYFIQSAMAYEADE
jgi:hypothetical protein